MTSKVYQCSEEEFIDLVIQSKTFFDIAQALGYSQNGRHSYDLIKKRCNELNIDTSHLGNRSGNGSVIIKQSLDEILVKNSTYQNMGSLKRRLINEKKLDYVCALCGNTGEWNGKELVLQLDHINGDHKDNRIENLRFLCPNCHSQTETFCTRQLRAKSE